LERRKTLSHYSKERTSKRERVKVSRPSCPSRSGATIKQHIGTPVVHPLIAMTPKHLLVPHSSHSFVVNVQPTFLIIVVFVRVEHINCIVPADCGLPVVVKHSI
jgi:hypothetical protein